MAALPPQPPGNLPPQPPSMSAAGCTTAVGPPQSPYLPAARTPDQMPPQPYVPPADAAAASSVKVHKRTFWLTIAQIIIIAQGDRDASCSRQASIASACTSSPPGTSHCATSRDTTSTRSSSATAFVNCRRRHSSSRSPSCRSLIGIVDLVLGIIVGRPSNVARWIIIVLDVLSIIVASSISLVRHDEHR